MPMIYSSSSRALQDKFDTRRLADRLAEVKVRDRLTLEDRQFIERMDMFFLATVDGEGQPTCSYKGGDPGFVTILDDQTLAFPNYDGNGMYLSMGNLAETNSVGMLFIDFELQRRMRIDGTAKIAMDDPLLERFRKPNSWFALKRGASIRTARVTFTSINWSNIPHSSRKRRGQLRYRRGSGPHGQVTYCQRTIRHALSEMWRRRRRENQA